jgi:hypothetical protein
VTSIDEAIKPENVILTTAGIAAEEDGPRRRIKAAYSWCGMGAD